MTCPIHGETRWVRPGNDPYEVVCEACYLAAHAQPVLDRESISDLAHAALRLLAGGREPTP